MGFLGEIERRRQQQVQQELSHKVELERQRQITVQKIAQEVAEENERLERIPRGFLKDCPTITMILDQLCQFGYKGYFEKVSEISGFKLEQIFYTEYPHVYFSSTDRKKTISELSKTGSELTKQQLNVQKKLEHAAFQLGWDKHMLWEARAMSKHPDVMFFGDNVEEKQKKLTESREVGIGIRFSKNVKNKEDRKYKYTVGEYDSVNERWDRAAYIRIRSHNGATITGSTQRQVDLKDLNLFDEVLQKAIYNPAKLYTKYTYSYRQPARRDSGQGGPCLPGNALISSPNGSVAIKNLKIGDFVWTSDRFGRRVKTIIVKKTKRTASKNHKVAHIILKDGRGLTVSLGHPTIDYKPIGSLAKGDDLDMSSVASIKVIPYKGKYTYDILPYGDTGGYWANNILIGSTLSDKFQKKKHDRENFYQVNPIAYLI